MKLLAVVKNPLSIARYLAAAGELTEVPTRSPGRGPPYGKSRVLRRQATGDENQRGDHSSKGERSAWPVHCSEVVFGCERHSLAKRQRAPPEDLRRI